MEFLSERVSVERDQDRTSIVISARLTRGKEALLMAWIFAWILCGAYVIAEVMKMGAGRERQFTIAFLVFWLYFLIRIGRVALWRLKGFELIRIKDGVLTIKNSIFGFGKARDHFVDNIQRLRELDIDERSWKWQLNESFWVMGGERLVFEHIGKPVVFGKGLSKEEARKVLALLEQAIKQERKAAQ